MTLFSCRRSVLKGDELQAKINELHHFYMPMDLNSAFHQSKLKAIRELDLILKNTSRQDLHEADFEELLLCALTVIYYFGMRLKLSRLTSRYWYWCGKRHFHKAEIVFQNTMALLQPERSERTIKITLHFFAFVELWPFESFVSQVLEVVLFFNGGKTILFNLMLTDIHYILFSDIKSARHRMRVLYELLNSENWIIDKQKLLPFITRLLDFFVLSITKSDNKIKAYTYLRKGFEVCLRRIFERAENQHRLMIITTMLNWFSMVNMNDEDVLEFSALLTYATELYKVGLYSESFREELFDHVLANLVGSSNRLYSLVGCHVLEKILDRKGNAVYLHVPTLYYEFSQVRLSVGEYDSGDKAFVRQYREKVHEYLLKAMKQHCSTLDNIKAIFTVICCLVLEVPCGLTAAAAAWMGMSIQSIALNCEQLADTYRYWMHAIVISIMSLICWVHKAPTLYRYVNQVISRRAKEAPQLNPPLLQYYYVAQHHITWNKPTLFFEDWELRYGLWKHFQDHLLFSLATLFLFLFAHADGRTKKVVIHVPYKVKKIKHTHTVYKTIHHHHTHHDHIDHGTSPSEEHEHFHHMHLHDEPPLGQHTQPIPGIGIPEFLPDVPLDVPLPDLPDLPRNLMGA
ncbi:uncharacterized protein LOC106133776 [Amyelois transitella]|uniref:uncharacterized protein LOC106133776 n=1 Tax=Amyelois transitella TaxID=680683 RepID=UPI00298F6399|nr:uncharacterized protein LOC106133776 [Amyelois transitella]